MTTPRVTVPVDELAQEIRRVDGNHDLGAGALAEALMPFLSSRLSAAPAPEGGAVKGLGDYTMALAEPQAFERFPALASHIERMAVGRSVGSLIEWDAFLRELNAALATRSDGKPEGGAVDDLREALIQADLKIRSLPGTDQSDVEFIREALATREAGERDRVKRAIADGFSNGYEQYDDASEMQRLSYDMAADAVLALRAQPPAREDAQPVAWRYKLDDETAQALFRSGWNFQEHKPPVQWGPYGRLITEAEPLYTHPAPDALRVASLSRFSPTSTGNNVAMMQEDEEGLYVLRKQVFVALKAEQKGGAA